MLALLLWIIHGMMLWWSWGQFRPRIALLHGLLLAVLAGGMFALGAPPGLAAGAGAVIGAVGGRGHWLAPGLWVGLTPLWALPFLLGTSAAFDAVGSFALTAQVAAAIASLTRPSGTRSDRR